MSEQNIKRVFITGGPGSFLCGIDERLRSFFKNTDNSDITPERQWIKDNDVEYIWAKSPDFDCSILKYIYDLLDIKCPWNYNNQRCVRTIKHKYILI